MWKYIHNSRFDSPSVEADKPTWAKRCKTKWNRVGADSEEPKSICTRNPLGVIEE
jgi:hypothetical protein